MKPCALSILLFLAAQPLRAPAQSFQAPCKTAQEFAALPENASVLTVQIALKKGRLVVDAAKTKASFSQRFKCTTKVISENQAMRTLIDDLNSLFATMPQLYWFGLTNSLQKQDQAGKLTDPDSNAIRQFTGDWQSAFAAYDKWANKILPGPHRNGRIGAAFSNYVNAFQTGHDLGALTMLDGASSVPPIINPDSKGGKLIFNITDPISGWVDPLDPSTATNQFKITTQNPTSPQHIRELITVLKPLQGHLWRKQDIVTLLEDFYFPQGLTQPQVFVMNTTARVTESVRIGRIVICPATTKKITAEVLLYSLLSTQDFETFLKDGSNFGQIAAPAPCLSFNYPAEREPLLNYNVFQVQQAAVSTLGFNVAPTPADSSGVASLLLQQGSSSAKTTSGKTGTTPPPGTTSSPSAPAEPVGGGVSRPSTSAAIPSPAPTATNTIDTQNASSDTSVAAPKLLNNFLGGGVDYRPGQGWRPFATYTRQRLSGLSDQDNLTLTVGANGKALGELDYSSSFAFFGALHHDLSLRLTGASDFQEKRFLLGTTDERRTGGLAHASYELFRDLDQMQLQVSIDARQTRVTLSPNGQPQLTTNVSTLDLGTSFVLDRINGRFGRHLELNPSLRLGLALTNKEPSYQTGTFSGSFQQNLPRLYQLHFNGKAQTASGGTPIFDLPSFGGEDSVRGFRQDDGLGRRVLSLQSELWSPIPGVNKSIGKIGQFLHRNVWMAGFFDAGGIFQSVDQVTGAKEGAGLGARVNYKLVIFKLDWAYGFGTGRTGDGRGRVYFSITNWLPL